MSDDQLAEAAALEARADAIASWIARDELRGYDTAASRIVENQLRARAQKLRGEEVPASPPLPRGSRWRMPLEAISLALELLRSRLTSRERLPDP